MIIGFLLGAVVTLLVTCVLMSVVHEDLMKKIKQEKSQVDMWKDLYKKEKEKAYAITDVQ